jgi:non-ribosomal peptide synthase protein (TIGR01720 family)
MKIGYKLQPRHLFEAQTIAELSRFVEKYQGELRADQGEVIGDVQLTPIQGWFFEQKFPQYWHWNQAVLVEVKRPLDVQILQYTLGVLLSHHDALRLRFRVDDDGRRIGHIEPSGGDLPFQVVDLTTFDEPDREWRLSEKIQEIQASLDIEKGPIIRLVYFRFDQKSTDRLFMVIHHLAIDGVSWRILFDDLRSLYDQFSRGISPTLTPKSTSIKAWSELLSEYAQNEAFSIEASYWQKILEEPVQSLPTDYRDQTNLQADEGIVQVFIDVPTTNSLLRELPITFGADINDALICVLVKTLTIWAGSSSIRIDLEGHGREDIIGNVDLSRTVGWFTSVYPVTFTMNTKMSLTDSLIAIKEKIRSIPHNGINFGVIRYLKSASSMNIESSEVSYNYLGQVTLGNSDDEIFSPARESTGHSLGLKNHRSHLLDFIASIVDGRLCLEWRYSEKIHKKETIETIADNFRSHLLELHRKCSGTSSAVYSPSDFKDVALRQDEIDLLMQELGFNEGEDTDQPLET